MIARERIEIWKTGTAPNNSGGQQTLTRKGVLLLSSLAQVEVLKPTRDQLAEQTKLGQTIKITMYARKGIELKADQLLYWKEAVYVLQGPPTPNTLGTEWTLFAKLSTL